MAQNLDTHLSQPEVKIQHIVCIQNLCVRAY